MSVYELAKQPHERAHTPATARASLSQRKCACGGTPGPDGECAACKAKRLARTSTLSSTFLPGQNVQANQQKTVGRPGHDFGKTSVRPVSSLVVDERDTRKPTSTIDGDRPAAAPQDGGSGGDVDNTRCRPKGRFTQIPKGTLTPTLGDTKFSAPFRMNAEFTTPASCPSGRGEYRQVVRGFFTVNDKPSDHPLCAETLSPTEWKEDCLTLDGTDLKYGYHSIPVRSSVFSNPDQATGDTFSGVDNPGFRLAALKSGDKMEMHLEFLGILYDPPTSLLLDLATWKVDGSGVVPSPEGK